MKTSRIVNFLESAYTKVALVVCTFMVGFEGGASGQSSMGSQIAESVAGELSTTSSSVVTLLMIVCGLYGAVQLVINGFKWSKGDQDAKDALFKWLIGIVIILAGLAVLQRTLMKGTATG